MREGVRFTDVRHPIAVAAELPTEPAMPATQAAEHDVLHVPEGVAIPKRFTDTEQAPPGGHLPESLGGALEEVDEHGAEVDDHLRDIRQGLLTITAELDQIGESTQALLSSRLYWIEFTETADGPDFATELANVGTTVRHLQRILAAAEGRSTP